MTPAPWEPYGRQQWEEWVKAHAEHPADFDDFDHCPVCYEQRRLAEELTDDEARRQRLLQQFRGATS